MGDRWLSGLSVWILLVVGIVRPRFRGLRRQRRRRGDVNLREPPGSPAVRAEFSAGPQPAE